MISKKDDDQAEIADWASALCRAGIALCPRRCQTIRRLRTAHRWPSRYLDATDQLPPSVSLQEGET